MPQMHHESAALYQRRRAAALQGGSFRVTLYKRREYLGAELVCVSESNSVTKGMKENERLN